MPTPILDSQVVPTQTWTWSTAVTDLAFYHDRGHNDVVIVYEDGSVRVCYPERWCFARWDRRERRFHSTSGVLPPSTFTTRALKHLT